MIETHPHRAATRISVYRTVRQAPRITTAITAQHAQHALPVSTQLVACPPHLHASRVTLAPQTTTAIRVQNVQGAWLASMPRLVTVETASAVRVALSRRRLVAQALMRVETAGLVSTAVLGLPRVISAPRVERTRTRMRPRIAQIAQQARTRGVAKHRAMSVRLVRLMPTRTLRHHAWRAWPVSTGNQEVQRGIVQRASSVLLAQRILTRTAPLCASTALRESTLRQAPLTAQAA